MLVKKPGMSPTTLFVLHVICAVAAAFFFVFGVVIIPIGLVQYQVGVGFIVFGIVLYVLTFLSYEATVKTL